MKCVFFANTDWYLYNFRRALAAAVRERGLDLILISPPGPYGERLLAEGFRWMPVPMARRSLNPFREAALVFYIVRLLKYERPDLVHGFTIKSAIYGSLAARLARIPARVSSIAGMGYVFTSNDFLARALRWPVRLAMRLALSGDTSRLILQNPDDVVLFKRERLFRPEFIRLVKGSGVDCARFCVGPGNSVDRRLRVLFPARLLWDKGLAEYVEAARRIRSQGREIQFIVAGQSDAGNPAAVPESTVSGWAEEGLLRWLGHVDDMAALFKSVDVVVLPSYREGLPKGLIEAGACGKAIVTTDVPGCREVVTHEVDGLLVPVADAEAIAVAVARLDDDRELLARLGQAARARALAEFDDRLITDQTLAVYRELIVFP